MKNIYKQVITPLCDLRNKPTDNTSLETQLLFGEKVKVLEKEKQWTFCENLNDNYKGWVKTENLGQHENSTHKVSKIITHLYSEPDIKSKIVSKLYFNSKINIHSKTKSWCSILFNKKKVYIFRKHIKKINENFKDWVRIALMFENSPYLWGGKSCNGIDCSGLVQISLNYCGIKFPRNTHEQINFSKSSIFSTKKIEKGSLIFWNGHVAIGINKNQIIHSNAFHLLVNKENFSNACERIKNSYGTVKEIKKIF